MGFQIEPPIESEALKAILGLVIQHVVSQQADMYRHKTHRCDDRIGSIHQPHVRPIIRGKLNKSVEFGGATGMVVS